MSVEQAILFRLADLPTIEAVQQVATRLGHDLQLSSVDLETHSGYLPAKLNGADTGFEVYIATRTADWPADVTLGWTHACTTRTGGDLLEAAAATIFLRAFLTCASGGYWYPDDQLYRPTDDAAGYLDGEIEAFKHLLSRRK